LVGTNVGLEESLLKVRLPGAVSASPTVKPSAAVLVSSLIVWSANPVIVGGVFTALTVSPNGSLALLVPSLTVTVIVAVPVCPVRGVTVTVRFVPLPPNTMLLAGTRVGFDDPALNVRLPTGVSASLIVNG